MKRILNNRLIQLILLTAIPGFLLFLLFFFVGRGTGGGFIVYIDQALFAKKSDTLNVIRALWNENNLGYINSIYIPVTFYAKLISWILFRVFDRQREVYTVFYMAASYLIYLSTFFSFYKIQKFLFKKNSLFLPAVSAFFYAFNFSIISNTGVLDSNLHIVSLTPLLIYILILQLNDIKNIRYLILEILLVSIVFNNIPFALGYLITIYPAFLLAALYHGISLSQIVKRYITIGFSVIITNAYFLYSYFYAYKNIMGGFFKTEGSGGYIFLNNGIRGIFQLIFDWTVQIFYNPNTPHPYYQYFIGNIGLFTSYLLWLTLIALIIIFWDEIIKLKAFIFILVALLISIFIIKGGQPPFREINLAIYKSNPIFAILRTPSSKLSLPIMLYISLVILMMTNLLKSRWIKLMLLFIILLQTVPFFIPSRFTGVGKTNNGRLIGYVEPNYKIIANILNSDKKEGSIYMYPGDYAGRYIINNHDFFSYDILGKMIDRPKVYSSDTISLNADKAIKKIPLDFDPKTVGDLSIRYILLRSDINDDVRNIKRKTKEAEGKILKTKGYIQKYKDQNLSLFEIKDVYYKNLFYLKGEHNIKNLTHEKKSPYEYSVTIPDIRIPQYSTLVFNNTHDPSWELVIPGKTIPAEKNSEKGFGNKWSIESLINEKGYSGNIIVYYLPQKHLFFAGVIALSAYLVLFALLIKFWKKY